MSIWHFNPVEQGHVFSYLDAKGKEIVRVEFNQYTGAITTVTGSTILERFDSQCRVLRTILQKCPQDQDQLWRLIVFEDEFVFVATDFLETFYVQISVINPHDVLVRMMTENGSHHNARGSLLAGPDAGLEIENYIETYLMESM